MTIPRLQVVKALSYPRGYGTRHLAPGDVFTARSARDHRLLLATKKVRELREPAAVPAPPPGVAQQIARTVAPSDELKALRARYAAVAGKPAFHGWSADQLREKIASAAPAA